MVKTTALRDKFIQLKTEMNGIILERNEEVNGLMLALLSRKHVFIVGPAGTSKSLMMRLLANQIDGAVYWEHQFSKYTEPDHVFGPPSVKALQEDSWRRVTKGRLPECHIGLADEIFKGNKSIRDAMLKIMNERMFDNDGAPQKCPLEVLMAASNEISSDENDQAFYDRFLMRYKVGYLSEDSHFMAMLKGPKKLEEFAKRLTVRLTLGEIHAAQVEASLVNMPDAVLEGMTQIRRMLTGQGIQGSDRRYNESIEVVKAKAWLQGRSEALVDDLGVLCHMLWIDPQHKALVQGAVLSVANPLLKKAEEQHDAMQIAMANLAKLPTDTPADKKSRASEATFTLSKINDALKTLLDIFAQGEKAAMDMSAVQHYIAVGRTMQERIVKDELGLTREYLGLK